MHTNSIEITLEDCRVDIAFSAYGGGVAEVFRDLLDRSNDRRFEGRLAIQLGELRERHRGKLDSGPGAEVLSGDVLAACFAQVIVDVRRSSLSRPRRPRQHRNPYRFRSVFRG